VEAGAATPRDGGEPGVERLLRFEDPDGLVLELVGVAGDEAPAGTVPWGRGPVPPGRAILGLHGVTLDPAAPYRTAAVLRTLGYDLVAETADRVRFRAPGDRATVVDLLVGEGNRPFGRHGVGTVHHVAVRSPADGDLSAWVDRLAGIDLDPTYVADRHYFRSVYVREPGGVLLEVAGDDPGVTVDEAPGELGSELRLPPWLADDREAIVSRLPAL
jgi:glyoxalase family protein